MKKQNSTKNILVAFILNICFSIFELIGGLFSGSISILSDSIHDLGDAIAIGLSYYFEKKSNKNKDNIYTYGYNNYSSIGSLITSVILIVGSIFMLIEAIERIFNPININVTTMLIISIVGVLINGSAVLLTRKSNSINQEAVNLHMLEDCLGWIAVFVGALVIFFTQWYIIDPILSMCVSVFILTKAVEHCFKTIGYLTNEANVNIAELHSLIKNINGVIDVHHIHVWKIDSNNVCATMHVVTNSNYAEIKNKIRSLLADKKINHITIEVEGKWEKCQHRKCNIQSSEQIQCSCCSNH